MSLLAAFKKSAKVKPIEPKAEDLSDLFNINFNKPDSCFADAINITQSTYLFLDKYNGNRGLATYLDTNVGYDAENPAKVKLGIKGTKEDIKER